MILSNSSSSLSLLPLPLARSLFHPSPRLPPLWFEQDNESFPSSISLDEPRRLTVPPYLT